MEATMRDHWNGQCCTDCLVYLANGETPPEMTEDETAAWLKRIATATAETKFVTLGRLVGEDGCDCTDRDTDEHREGCERTDFSWSSCDHCGSGLGGERHAITGWLA